MYRKYRIVECIASSASQYESYRDQVYRYTPSQRCSNYIFILNLTPGFNGLGKDNCKTRWESNLRFYGSWLEPLDGKTCHQLWLALPKSWALLSAKLGSSFLVTSFSIMSRQLCSPAWRQKPMAVWATHCDTTSNIVGSYLLTSWNCIMYRSVQNKSVFCRSSHIYIFIENTQISWNHKYMRRNDWLWLQYMKVLVEVNHSREMDIALLSDSLGREQTISYRPLPCRQHWPPMS